ncbi:hypothetical protein C6989_03560 [Nitrosopumilus sp. b2]|nr:hypothetical protein C6989_03560 [Nitrosopumilus sp. b2]
MNLRYSIALQSPIWCQRTHFLNYFKINSLLTSLEECVAAGNSITEYHAQNVGLLIKHILLKIMDS